MKLMNARICLTVRFFALFLWILSLSSDMMAGVVQAADTETILYDARGKRDPFVPLVSNAIKQAPGLLNIETVDDVKIEGVVFDPKNGSVVIINGSVLKEGEEMESLKVISVRADGVKLSVNGMEAFKPINPENPQQDSTVS